METKLVLGKPAGDIKPLRRRVLRVFIALLVVVAIMATKDWVSAVASAAAGALVLFLDAFVSWRIENKYNLIEIDNEAISIRESWGVKKLWWSDVQAVVVGRETLRLKYRGWTHWYGIAGLSDGEWNQLSEYVERKNS